MTVSAADGGGCGRGFRLQVTGPIEWCHGLIFRRTETNGQWAGAVVFDFQHDAIFAVAVLLAGVKLDYRAGQCYDVLHTPWGYVKWGCRFMPRKAMSKLSTPKTHGKSAGIGLAQAHGQGVNRVGSGGKALAVDPDKKIGNLHRLKRIEGQIRGLHDMVQRDRYCADILIQIAAVQKSLASVARQVLGNHLKHCVSQNIRAGGAQADAACEELLKLLSHIDR